MVITTSNGVSVFQGWASSDVIAGFTSKGFSGSCVETELTQVLYSAGVDLQRVVYLTQVHSTIVVTPMGSNTCYIGDGFLTNESNLAVIVWTADCLPLFFYHHVSGLIGIVHVGWQGARDGIIEAFFEAAASRYTIHDAHWQVCIGPGLRQCCFRVESSFCIDSHMKNFVASGSSDVYTYDSIGFVRYVLKKYGIDDQSCYDSRVCSFCNNDFHSFRRDHTDKRTVSFIVKKCKTKGK